MLDSNKTVSSSLKSKTLFSGFLYFGFPDRKVLCLYETPTLFIACSSLHCSFKSMHFLFTFRGAMLCYMKGIKLVLNYGIKDEIPLNHSKNASLKKQGYVLLNMSHHEINFKKVLTNLLIIVIKYHGGDVQLMQLIKALID